MTEKKLTCPCGKRHTPQAPKDPFARLAAVEVAPVRRARRERRVMDNLRPGSFSAALREEQSRDVAVAHHHLYDADFTFGSGETFTFSAGQVRHNPDPGPDDEQAERYRLAYGQQVSLYARGMTSGAAHGDPVTLPPQIRPASQSRLRSLPSPAQLIRGRTAGQRVLTQAHTEELARRWATTLIEQANVIAAYASHHIEDAVAVRMATGTVQVGPVAIDIVLPAVEPAFPYMAVTLAQQTDLADQHVRFLALVRSQSVDLTDPGWWAEFVSDGTASAQFRCSAAGGRVPRISVRHSR